MLRVDIGFHSGTLLYPFAENLLGLVLSNLLEFISTVANFRWSYQTDLRAWKALPVL